MINDALIKVQNIICDKPNVMALNNLALLFWWNYTLLQYDVPVECGLSGGDNGVRFLQHDHLELDLAN